MLISPGGEPVSTVAPAPEDVDNIIVRKPDSILLGIRCYQVYVSFSLQTRLQMCYKFAVNVFSVDTTRHKKQDLMLLHK